MGVARVNVCACEVWRMEVNQRLALCSTAVWACEYENWNGTDARVRARARMYVCVRVYVYVCVQHQSRACSSPWHSDAPQ